MAAASAAAPDGAGDAVGDADRRHRVDAGQVGPRERHRRPARAGRHELGGRAVGPGHASAPVAPAGIGSVTGVAGRDRLGRRGRAAEQLAGQVGEQDREGDLERQVGAARLEGEDRGRQAGAVAGVQQRRALRARDDGPRPVRRASAAAPAEMWVVDRST